MPRRTCVSQQDVNSTLDTVSPVRTRPRWARARRLWAGLFAVVVVGTLAGPASATWTAPLDISRSGRDAAEPDVAVDGNGNAVLVWSREVGTTGRVQVRVLSADGRLSPVQTVSRARETAFASDVAVDPDGDAVIVWQSAVPESGLGLQVQARARSANGTLSRVQTLSAANIFAVSPEPQVAVDADGDAVITWQTDDLSIQARARSADGTLSPIQTLATEACCPQVGVDADGDAVFTWHKFGTPNRVEARARSADGTLSPIEDLSPVGQTAHFPNVAVDADGGAVFAWEGHDGTTWRIQARARSADGTLSPVEWLSAVGHQAFAPQVAVDTDGDAVFTWHQLFGDIPVSAESQWSAFARARSADGILSTIQELSAPAAQLSDQRALPEPKVAVDADGDAVFLWKRFDGTNVRVQARARSADGTLSAVETLSAAGQDVHRGHEIAVDIDGDAVATWRRFDGTNWRVQAVTGP
jgi:hypothetical protein